MFNTPTTCSLWMCSGSIHFGEDKKLNNINGGKQLVQSDILYHFDLYWMLSWGIFTPSLPVNTLIRTQQWKCLRFIFSQKKRKLWGESCLGQIWKANTKSCNSIRATGLTVGLSLKDDHCTGKYWIYWMICQCLWPWDEMGWDDLISNDCNAYYSSEQTSVSPQWWRKRSREFWAASPIFCEL